MPATPRTAIPPRSPVDHSHEHAVRLGDDELVRRARRGDGSAIDTLHDRHHHRVAALSGKVDATAYADARSHLVAAVTGDGPVPAVVPAWLTALCGSEGPDAVGLRLAALPPTWQTGLWHHCVERDPIGVVAQVLGTDVPAAARTVRAASRAMEAAVLREHPLPASGRCRRLMEHQFYRDFHADSADRRRRRRALSDHARTCDPCLGLVRALSETEHHLPDRLAMTVLGDLAPGYLASRGSTVPRLPHPARSATPRRAPALRLAAGAWAVAACVLAGHLGSDVAEASHVPVAPASQLSSGERIPA